MITTRGRYALRVMIDLAEHIDDGYIPMKEVAKRQGLSLKYLERIMPALSKNGLMDGVHGKGGGYRLNRLPENYTAGEIFVLWKGILLLLRAWHAVQSRVSEERTVRPFPCGKSFMI